MGPASPLWEHDRMDTVTVRPTGSSLTAYALCVIAAAATVYAFALVHAPASPSRARWSWWSRARG